MTKDFENLETSCEKRLTAHEIEKSGRHARLLKVGKGEILNFIGVEEAADHLLASIESGHKIVIQRFLGIGTNPTLVAGKEMGRNCTFQVSSDGQIAILPEGAAELFPLVAEELKGQGIIHEDREFGQFVEVKE